MRTLEIYNNDIAAGILTEENPGKGYTFLYHKDYLESSLPGLSVNLPKREEPYTADYLFPFFSNMIPEGANRKIICRARHIDESDIFGILYAMANQDFIGAVNIRRVQDD